MQKIHSVGIDLGTTYSSIAYLNEHGEPVTLPNQEGDLATPSVVLFEGSEAIVGQEALRNAIANPTHVVQNSKRFIGDHHRRWTIEGKAYTPVDVASLILRKLLDAARERIGLIDRAVITVPAQFSDVQRQETVEAGLRAGLKRVDIINEPVAAALCYVLGAEGLWFTELASEQHILVYDLGGGTFDLSLVKYTPNEVTVVASGGELYLGGIDWNLTLQNEICKQFQTEFGEDPSADDQSLQFLALEVENTKRSLTVRSRAVLTCQHAGHRKTYQIEQGQFEALCQPLVRRTQATTQQLLRDNKMGWAHVDVILTTGGASRMPMIRKALQELGGRTLNTSLSPDQSIAHGATYYAGMLLTNDEFARSILRREAQERLSQLRQRNVNARSLGILVRDKKTARRVPCYLIPANTQIPASAAQTFGTVVENQKRVHLQIVESGANPDEPYVKLGACVIDNLAPGLPEGAKIDVTFSYDEQARVHIAARDLTSGHEATAEIVREENLVQPPPNAPSVPAGATAAKEARAKPQPAAPRTEPRQESRPESSRSAEPRKEPKEQTAPKKSGLKPAQNLEDVDFPVPLCNQCGEPLDLRGKCPACGGPSTAQGKERRRASQGASNAATRRARKHRGRS